MLKRTLVLSLFLASLAASIHADDKFITHVTLTTYNATKAQCDNSPNKTANGTIIDHKKLKQGKSGIHRIYNFISTMTINVYDTTHWNTPEQIR